MKVLSDFSFIERAVIEVWVWLWFLQKVWSADRFASLEWHRIRKFNLKSYITLLILLMLPLQMTFDITWTYIKYDEGFMVDPLSGTIIAKPAYYYTPEGQIISIWSKENLLLKKITEYILACGFALQTGTLFLMQSFWSHLAGQVGGKTFMRSWEFKFYIGWALISMIAFPVIRGLSEKDIILVETGPQLIYSIQLFAIFLLGIRNDRRLNNLLVSIQRRNVSTGQEAFVRIHYFIDINKFLTLGTFLTSIGFLVISTDAIGRFNCVTSSKFLMDLFIIHTNLGSLILWVTMTLIIYPRHDAAIWASSLESKKLTQIRVDNR